jgi:ATP-dependent Clp protease ATP-binding subunit ClpX
MIEKCSFCGSIETEDNPLLAAPDDSAFICKNCVITAYNIILGAEKEEKKKRVKLISTF